MKNQFSKLETKLEKLSSSKLNKVYGGFINRQENDFFDDCSCNNVAGCGTVKPPTQQL